MTFSLQNGNTALIGASQAGRVDCVKLLLAEGAQADHQNKLQVGIVQDWIQGFWKGVAQLFRT